MIEAQMKNEVKYKMLLRMLNELLEQELIERKSMIK